MHFFYKEITLLFQLSDSDWEGGGGGVILKAADKDALPVVPERDEGR